MDKINLFNDKSECCGCGACMVVCPKNAITMVEDEIGVLYPEINETLCIKCGKCLRSCSYKDSENGTLPIKAVGAISNVKELYDKSASGGVFSLIASEFIKDSGIVAGSVEENNSGLIDCKHVLGSTLDEIEPMFGSKYVQSRAYETFEKIEDELKHDNKVLFCGTPCQVSALKRILPDHNNLYTIDLICHGTPPVRMLQDFLFILSKKLHSKITSFAFRDKNAGTGFKAAVSTDKRKFYFSHGVLSYYKLFLDGMIYRQNCYSCPYAQKKRVGDLTIGDFWGIEKHLPKEQTEGRYWSCILINSEKGQHLIDNYGKELTLIDSDFESVARMNEQLKKPHDIPELRKKYLDLYKKEGYPGIEREYKKHMGGAFKFFIKEKKQILDNIFKTT